MKPKHKNILQAANYNVKSTPAEANTTEQPVVKEVDEEWQRKFDDCEKQMIEACWATKGFGLLPEVSDSCLLLFRAYRPVKSMLNESAKCVYPKSH